MPSDNILLLMTDQQRWDSLGVYGCDWAHTPNLDRLGRDGIVFDNCTVNNPICTPSRASLMTGKHLPGHGVYRLYDLLPGDEVLFPERLRQAGYHTALFGKLHVSSKEYEHYRRHPHDGFDVHEFCMEGSLDMDAPHQAYAQWLRERHPAFYERLRRDGRRVLHLPQEVHMTRWVADRAIDFLGRQDETRPFFCKASLFDPHSPYQDHPLEMRDLVDADRIPDPLWTRADGKNLPQAVRRQQHAPDRISLETLREDRLGYHASIAFADQEFGRILQTLEERGLDENTWVFFVSDHGDMLGDRRLTTKGGFFYEACVRVPLLIRPPRRLGVTGRRTSALVQPHDLAATILGIAHLPVDDVRSWMPEALDLTPLCLGRRDVGHDHALCCYRNSGLSCEPSRTPYFDPPIHGTMIRDERHKLNLFHAPGDWSGHGEGELYDLSKDPLENCNLWQDAAHAGIKSDLLDTLLSWLRVHETRPGSRGGEALPARSRKGTRSTP